MERRLDVITPTAPRSEALDAVRGIAISAVIGYHFWPSVLPSGFIGVELFFVLSGYLIGGILLDNRRAHGYFGVFYWRRAFRILPLYWILLTISTAKILPKWVFLVFGQNVGWSFVTPFPNGSDLSITWSLAVEEQFYLVLPLLIYMLPQRALVCVLWVCVIAAPLWRFGFFLSAFPSAAWFVLPCNLDALMGGTLVACLARGYARSRIIWAVLALLPPSLEIFANKLNSGNFLNSFWALIFGLAVWLVIRNPALSRLAVLRPLAWCGVGAYSLYLFQLLILRLTGSPYIALPIALAFAWASWRYIEAPLIRFARARWRYRQAEVCVPTPVLAA